MSFPHTPPTVSQSSSTLSSSSSHGATPKPTIKTVFERVGITPPAKSDQYLEDDVKVKVDSLLQPIMLSYNQLNAEQQTGISFLLMRHQDEKIHATAGDAASSDPTFVAMTLRRALVTGNIESKRFLPFFQKGGDRSQDGMVVKTNYFSEFVRKYPVWGDQDKDKGVCIFVLQDHQNLKPFIRFQEPISEVCYLIAAANAILYYMLLTTGTQYEEAVTSYGINVGRYMRGCLSEEAVHRMVFGGGGGFPVNVLEDILTHCPCTTTSGDTTKTAWLDLWPNENAQSVFWKFYYQLVNAGAVLVEGFRPFPAYGDLSNTLFHGDWEDVKGTVQGQLLHAVLIVGVRRLEDSSMGGVQFLIQDSFPGRPFFAIGLDLLRSMKPSFRFIKAGVTFDGTELNAGFDNVPDVTMSGSVSGTSQDDSTSFSDKGQGNVVRRKKPYFMGFDALTASHVENGVAVWTGPIPEGWDADH